MADFRVVEYQILLSCRQVRESLDTLRVWFQSSLTRVVIDFPLLHFVLMIDFFSHPTPSYHVRFFYQHYYCCYFACILILLMPHYNLPCFPRLFKNKYLDDIFKLLQTSQTIQYNHRQDIILHSVHYKLMCKYHIFIDILHIVLHVYIKGRSLYNCRLSDFYSFIYW